MTRTRYARLAAVLKLVTILDALVLAVALYAITREDEPDLAGLAMSCCVSDGVIAAIPTIATIGLLSIATSGAGAAAADAAAANALGALLLKVDSWSTKVGATVFAAGSTIYSYLFLRARSSPAPLAWLGLVASVLLVFEVALGPWLQGSGRAATGSLDFVTAEN